MPDHKHYLYESMPDFKTTSTRPKFVLPLGHDALITGYNFAGVPVPVRPYSYKGGCVSVYEELPQQMYWPDIYRTTFAQMDIGTTEEETSRPTFVVRGKDPKNESVYAMVWVQHNWSDTSGNTPESWEWVGALFNDYPSANQYVGMYTLGKCFSGVCVSGNDLKTVTRKPDYIFHMRTDSHARSQTGLYEFVELECYAGDLCPALQLYDPTTPYYPFAGELNYDDIYMALLQSYIVGRPNLWKVSTEWGDAKYSSQSPRMYLYVMDGTDQGLGIYHYTYTSETDIPGSATLHTAFADQKIDGGMGVGCMLMAYDW